MSYISSQNVPTPYGFISGLLPLGFSGTNTTAFGVIGKGMCAANPGNDLDKGTISWSTVQSGLNPWQVSNGNAPNGFDGGTTLPNSSTIHIFICQGSSGTCLFGSTSLLPTFPAGYDSKFRRVFSFITNSSGTIRNTTVREMAGGGLHTILGGANLDINGATPGNASRTLYTLAALPNGLYLRPLYLFNPNQATQGAFLITGGDEPDVAVAAQLNVGAFGYFNAAPGWNTGCGLTPSVDNYRPIYTNTLRQIGIRQTAAPGTATVYWVTHGWIDERLV